jgi:hypothetical protein
MTRSRGLAGALVMIGVLSSCTHSPSTMKRSGVGLIRGNLLVVGGAGPDSPRGASGVVTLHGPAAKVVPTGADGVFQARVAYGAYTATGQLSGGNAMCRSHSVAHVRAGRAAVLEVICDVK